ncbi:MAG: MerR family DNA-binding transcriptional regulator, partial [Candidatus Schekmanbacteria bacterium]|nr:MerR family DNA-binding transcriptional regulator [Candidatus Schekmanbacteria bacterium]MBI2571287.1 MerR family DNA-binding transcriptional regulator [Candidatus Schekmanbacteria bacterium]
MDVSLTPGEAARILGISVRTLHRWDKAGKIRCE